MNAQEFVNLLRTLNVLDTAATESLRGQAQVVNNQLSPQQILKSLLDAGQITPACHWYDTVTLRWSSKGCMVSAVTAHTA